MSETNVEYEIPQPAVYKIEWPEIPAVYDHEKKEEKAPRVRGGIGRTSCPDIANKCIYFKWDIWSELERDTKAERAEALKDAIARDGNTLGGWDGNCTKFLYSVSAFPLGLCY